MSEVLKLDGLTYYDGKIKNYIGEKVKDSLKYVEFADNAIKFYTNNPKSEGEEAAFSIDMPEEYFLDQTATVFVNEFAWSNTAYPGSTNPNLEGEPVLVLAVKGGDSIAYSFVNLKTLIDVYTGGVTNSATVNVSADNKVTVDIKVSAVEGNLLEVKEDGLYVGNVDISGKADKLVGDAIKAGQIFVDDGNGNLAASGKTIADLEPTAITNEQIDALFA